MNRIIFLNPIYMILTFITLSIIGNYSYIHNYLVIYDFSLLLLSIVLYGWAIIFTNYMHIKYNSAEQLEYKKSIYLFLYVIFVQFIPIFLDFYYNNYDYKINYIFRSVLAIASIYSIFYILWAASKSLIIAEMGGKAGIRDKIPTNRIIGTFFEFFYLPFFIVFLARRLRTLEKLR